MADDILHDSIGRGYSAAALGGAGGADAVPVYAGKSGTISRPPGKMSSAPASENVVSYVPVNFKAGDVIAKLALFVSAPGNGAAVADIGIYSSTANGRPAARLAHTGNLSVTSQPAAHAVTLTIPATGRYFAAFVTTGSAGTPVTTNVIQPEASMAADGVDPLAALNSGDFNGYAEVGSALPATASSAPIAIDGGYAVAYSFA